MSTALLPRDALTWSQFLRDFDGAYRTFTENRQALIAVGPYVRAKHPELMPQYDSLLQRANELAPRLTQLASMKGTVAGWLQSSGITRAYQGAVDATSAAIEKVANGINAARRALGLGDLSAVPLLVPIAAAGAVAVTIAVTKWVSDAYLMAKRLNALQELEAKGYTADEAASTLNKVLGDPEKAGSIERTLQQVLWIVAIGGGLFLLSRMMDSAPRRS